MSQSDCRKPSNEVLSAKYSLTNTNVSLTDTPNTPNITNTNINTKDNVKREPQTDNVTRIKKKGRKQSYKDMMGNLMQSKLTEEEVQETHNTKIKNCTGGGTFKKGNLERL